MSGHGGRFSAITFEEGVQDAPDSAGSGVPSGRGSFVEEKPVQAGLACRPCALAGAEKLSENRPWGQGFFSALLTVRLPLQVSSIQPIDLVYEWVYCRLF